MAGARTAVEFGYGGDVTLTATGLVANFFEWSATTSREIHDVTDWESADNAKAKAGGRYKLTGTAKCFFHGTSPTLTQMQAEAGGATAGFVLTRKTGKTYTFSGLVTNIRETFNKSGGIPIQEISFVSSGAIVDV